MLGGAKIGDRVGAVNWGSDPRRVNKDRLGLKEKRINY